MAITKKCYGQMVSCNISISDVIRTNSFPKIIWTNKFFGPNNVLGPVRLSIFVLRSWRDYFEICVCISVTYSPEALIGQSTRDTVQEQDKL